MFRSVSPIALLSNRNLFYSVGSSKCRRIYTEWHRRHKIGFTAAAMAYDFPLINFTQRHLPLFISRVEFKSSNRGSGTSNRRKVIGHNALTVWVYRKVECCFTLTAMMAIVTVSDFNAQYEQWQCYDLLYVDFQLCTSCKYYNYFNNVLYMTFHERFPALLCTQNNIQYSIIYFQRRTK